MSQNAHDDKPVTQYRYLFGPVPSRRLGLSLGVDLIPPKTCSFNCIFCQAGRTTCLTVDRKAYVPVHAIVAELGHWLRQGGTADFITLAGSGEPTLHSGFGRIIDFVHRHSKIKVAVLTNGSLLHDPVVRRAAAKADMVKISLNAWDPASFNRIQRPDSHLTFEQHLEGLRAFRRLFKGQVWLEVFLVSGINSDTATVKRLAELARSIHPDRIHINTAVRPPAEVGIRPVTPARIAKLAALFQPRAEVMADFSTRPRRMRTAAGASVAAVVSLVRRHPSTVRDIAAGLGVPLARVRQWVQVLQTAGRITAGKRGGRVYYM
jgi:wyosine [tRNA(Phe)-imidazoG37] synthetase (radical SAM superfamily)